MGLETATTIAGLDSSFPLPDDLRRQGDDHLRLIKDVLKAQFPGVGGVGYDAVIVATEAELNHLSGVTSPIQAQLDAITDALGGVEGVLTAPVGTRMLFHQATPPPGWESDTTQNNRLVITSNFFGGGELGKDNPRLWTHQHGTQAHTLSTSEIPGHVHEMMGQHVGALGRITWDSEEVFHQKFHPDYTEFSNGFTAYAGGTQSHEHGNTLSVDWEPLVSLYTVGVKV